MAGWWEPNIMLDAGSEIGTRTIKPGTDSHADWNLVAFHTAIPWV